MSIYGILQIVGKIDELWCDCDLKICCFGVVVIKFQSNFLQYKQGFEYLFEYLCLVFVYINEDILLILNMVMLQINVSVEVMFFECDVRNYLVKYGSGVVVG